MASPPPNPREGEEGGSEFPAEASGDRPPASQKTFVAPPAAQLPSKLQYVALGQPGPSGIKQCFRSVKTARRVPTLPRRTREEPEPRPRRDRTKRHLCTICDKRFSSPGKLTQHLLSHTGELPFSCNSCDKRFNSKFKLVRHSLIHNEDRAFSCTVCGKTFNRKDHLTNHVRVHDPLKKMYTCERSDCRKSYTSSLSYRKHMALHSAEEGNLQCKICNEVFDSKQEIIFHLKVHTGSRTVKNETDKKFTCEFCDRRFFTAKDVRRHLVVHTGRRDFLCPHCPQKFGRKDHLVRHVKNAHPEESWRSAAVGTSTDPLPEPPPDDPHPVVEFEIEPEFGMWKSDVKTEIPVAEGTRTRVPSSDIIVEIPPLDIKVEPLEIKVEEATSPEGEILGYGPYYIGTFPQTSTEMSYLGETSSLPEQIETELLHSNVESLLMDPGEGTSGMSSQMVESSRLLELLERDDSYSQSEEPRQQRGRVSLPAFKQVFQTSQSPKPPPPPPQ